MHCESGHDDLMVASGHDELVEMFSWARDRALRWAHPGGTRGPVNVDEHRPLGTGEGVYLPSYWAGYAHRSGFYLRDFVHQAAGAHLLGLAEANLTMLRRFAASATAEHGHRPVWAFNFDGSYLSIDYRGPGEFVREVPAVFELVECVAELHRWTGDAAYVHDPVLRDYCANAIALPATARGTSIFEGVASYNELGGEPLAVAGDGLATQYAAHLAMAALARARGEDGDRFETRAAELRRHYEQDWKGARGFTLDGRPVTGWGAENSFFMPLKGLRDDPAYLDYVDAQASGPGRPANVEAWTYLPDVFFRNGRPEAAWRWMREIFHARTGGHVAGGLNGDYPEVSFTLVSQVVAGLLGVRPDAPANALSTLSRLPAEIGWAAVSGVPIGRGRVAVRHDGGEATTLTNLSGQVTYTWTAAFPDGSATTLEVPPGATVTAVRC
ncbi:hypothetical protein [Nonomuraea rhodomycinica]|uniref:Alpha-L-rhamnosidase six-hairpin glycosidase domain-containing protein n=1 Tax=Nonomuraea rhodomycinica TaxID=1712872 RepID=A0A7Y6IVF8_9ACTN|nr:hypothetical protein [Nonomuraea rhodomycinica]NUW45040.1 hypothetical protein [Nonomuraea rhodomycinica]